MRAMVLEEAGGPLVARIVEAPTPGAGQILLDVSACGVCRTDLHILDGDLAPPDFPRILGHQVVGTVATVGDGVQGVEVGDRLGVGWLGSTDGTCRYCRTERENLCENPQFTGYNVDGGFAERMVADPRFCFPIPEDYDDVDAAPLLCAGLIGYRALRLAGDGRRVGLYGFGAAAHILAQLLRYQGRHVYAFTRPGDEDGQEFARSLGARWAGGSDESPPDVLDSAIIFAPVGRLVPEALRAVDKGGRVVCAGIHMSDIPSFAYEDLWEERMIRSVANLTRRDGTEFLEVAPDVPVRTQITRFPLEEANEALEALRDGDFEGAAVLEIG